MNKPLLFLAVFLLLFNLFTPVEGEILRTILENDYQAENQYGPHIGDLVANPGQQSWVRLDDKVYINGNSGKQTEKIGTIENGARLHCVGLMVDSGWYRVVAQGRLAYVSFMYTWLDTSARPGPSVHNPLDILVVQASSERPRSKWTDGAGNYYYYDAGKMIDADPTTAWTPGSGNKLIDDGIGQYADFRFRSPVQLESVQILNGYQRSEEAFYENSRPKRIEVSFQRTFSDTFSNPLTFEIYDNLVGWQHMNFMPQEDVIAFRLRILDVYRGTEFSTDVGISEVRASGY